MPIPIASLPFFYVRFHNFLYARTRGALGTRGKHLAGHDVAYYYSLPAATCLRRKLLDTPAYCPGGGRGSWGAAAKAQMETTPAAGVEGDEEWAGEEIWLAR